MCPMKRFVAAVALTLAVGVWSPLSGQGAGAPHVHWVGTWMTASIARTYPPVESTPPPAGAVQPAAAQALPPPLPDNQTLRQIVRVTLGGDRVRVVLTNAFGTTPLVVGAAHVALRDNASTIVPASDRELRFSGQPSIAIPAGAVMVSDPVALTVPAFADVAVDVYFPERTGAHPVTIHRAAHQTSYISQTGNHAGAGEFPVAGTLTAWAFLGDVEVLAPGRTPTVIVALGDSITDGSGSTADTNNRWPDHFARRLQHEGAKMALLNAGIGGNRVLSDSIPEFGVNLLARFDRDVLVQAGVTHLVVMEGINDIGNARDNASPTAADLIAAQQQIIERAHARGLKVMGATLTPFEGATYFTTTGETKRQALNEWIRTGKAYDGVIDFDAAARDPQQSAKLLAAYDSGDHLHPSDAGYEAMGRAISLALFK